MNVLVIGSSGFIGRKLVEHLGQDRKIGDKAIGLLTLADAVRDDNIPESSQPYQVRSVQVDITDPTSVQELLKDRPQVIVHLAAVVSGQAENDFVSASPRWNERL